MRAGGAALNPLLDIMYIIGASIGRVYTTVVGCVPSHERCRFSRILSDGMSYSDSYDLFLRLPSAPASTLFAVKVREPVNQPGLVLHR